MIKSSSNDQAVAPNPTVFRNILVRGSVDIDGVKPSDSNSENMNSTISTLLSLACLLFIAVHTSAALSITDGPQGGSPWGVEDEEQPADYRSVLKLMKYEILVKLMNDLCGELDMCPPSQVPARQAPVVRRGENTDMRRAPHLFWRTAILNKAPGSILKGAN